jgi:hypothetical protein
MGTDSPELPIASSLEWTEEVVDAAFPKLVSRCYSFVVVDDQARWSASSGIRDMQWVRR